MLRNFKWLVMASALLFSCKSDQEIQVNLDFEIVKRLQNGLMHVISEDLFVPPVASRIYAYSHLAGYESIQNQYDSYNSFEKDIKIEISKLNDQAQMGAFLESFCMVAKHLVYRDFLIDQLKQAITSDFGVDTLSSGYIKGKETGTAVANEIIQRADSDGYIETRTKPKYTVGRAASSWQSTAPTFGEALEPYWSEIKPFFVTSSKAFRSDMPIEFDSVASSQFFEEAKKVQGYVARANEDSVAVATYWDCNPGPTMLEGHFMLVRKQNTPGGHWLGIVSQMAEQHKFSLIESAYIMTKVAMGIADGFICAWDTKYEHDLLRPETYIQKYIDSDWRPKLESPLFPEYSSAHSVVSAICATLLTDAFGDQVSFIDSTNISFGYSPRSFNNFWEAAQEAATSRLLGGIHYPFACEDGISQGKKIGEYILGKNN